MCLFVALVKGQVRSGGRCLQGTKRANKNKTSEGSSLELVHHCFCFKLLIKTSHGAKVIKAGGWGGDDSEETVTSRHNGTDAHMNSQR